MRTVIAVGSSLQSVRNVLVRLARRPVTIAVVLVLAACAVCVGALRDGWIGFALGLPHGVESSYAHVAYDSGVLHISGLRLSDRRSGASLSVNNADVRGLGAGSFIGRPGSLDVSLDGAQLTLFADDVSAEAFRGANAWLHAWTAWQTSLRLHVNAASVTLALSRADAEPLLQADAFAGTLDASKGALQKYAFEGACDIAGTSYPVHATAVADVVGRVSHRWTAKALPIVAVIAALHAAPDLVAREGTVRDLDVRYSRGESEDAVPHVSVDAHVQDVIALVGSSGSEVRAVHGRVLASQDGIASPLLTGTIDGVPLEVAGELHDIHGAPLEWLVRGTDDLRALTRLAGRVPATDDVQSLRVEHVAPGVALAQYATVKPYGPLVVTLAAIDPKEPTLRFDTVMAGDHITSGGERTSTMGSRTKAVLGINGDYYDIGGSWAPQGVVVRSGVLLRTPAQRMALAIHRDKRVSFQEYRLDGTVQIGGERYPLTQLNSWPAGDVTLVTPEYGTIPPAPGVTLVRLEPVASDAGAFRVTSVGPAISAVAPTYALGIGSLVHVSVRVGTIVRVHYGLLPSADDVIASIGGGPLLLRNGAWYEDPHAPAPDERNVHWAVVALGRLPDDSLMIMQVDGRHPERSIGMTRPDFAKLLHSFGVVDAMALDSGGSSTLVSRIPGETGVSVRNHPSDNDGERFVSNGLFLYSGAPSGPSLLGNPRAADRLASRP